MINRLKLKFTRDLLVIKKIFFELKMKITGNTRPHSYPYITSDTFRFLADHVYDNVDQSSKIPDVKERDTVFVNSNDVEEYFKYIHPKIKNKYVLITHWGIKPVDDKITKYIDDKIIHWFGKNVLIEHPKITPLPIGLEDLHRYGTGVVSHYKKKRKSEGKNKILYHFKIATNPSERQKAYDYISRHTLAETYSNKLPPPLYLKKLSEYNFVLSPPGAGEECHRSWEALYLDIIPIIKTCTAIEYFAKIGVPIWVVNDWNDLDNISEDTLKQKYSELTNKKNEETLYIDYWIKKIATYTKTNLKNKL